MRREHHKAGPVHRREILADPYLVLGIGRDAGDGEIRRAYLDLVRRHPPERDPETFKRIRKAYELLATPESRAATLLSVPEPPPGNGLAVMAAPVGPSLAGIPLAFLLAFDPWADLSGCEE